jgi:hypothetical protein
MQQCPGKISAFLLIVAAAVLPGGRASGYGLHAAAPARWTRDGEDLAGAIGFFDGDLQIAAAAA